MGSMAMKYRKKPVVIEAVLWDGNLATVEPLQARSRCTEVQQELGSDDLLIPTIEGVMTARRGDWVILGVKNELYPCRDDIFQQTYEPVE